MWYLNTTVLRVWYLNTTVLRVVPEHYSFESGTWTQQFWECGTWTQQFWECGTWTLQFWEWYLNTTVLSVVPEHYSFESGTWTLQFWECGTWTQQFCECGTWTLQFLQSCIFYWFFLNFKTVYLWDCADLQLLVFQQNLASWQNGEWRFRSPGTWCYVTGPVVFIILNDHSACIFRGTVRPWRCSRSQKTWIFNVSITCNCCYAKLFFLTAATYCQGEIPLFSKVWCSVWHLLLYSSCRVVCWYHTSSAKHTGSVQSGASSDIIALFSSNDPKGREVITSAGEAPFACYTDAGYFKVKSQVQSPDSIFSMVARLQDGQQGSRSILGQDRKCFPFCKAPRPVLGPDRLSVERVPGV